MTSQRYIRKGALQVIYAEEFWESDPNCILVFNDNNTSIMHSFRFNQALPLARINIIALSSQWGAAGDC